MEPPHNLTKEQLEEAVQHNVQLRGADLSFAQLEGANLSHAQLEEADLSQAQLKGADLSFAQLKGAHLFRAQLEGAHLFRAQLEGANLVAAELKGADLEQAQLEGANLQGAELEGANLSYAQLKRADLYSAQLKGANLSYAQLKEARLQSAHLEKAHLLRAQLEGTDLSLVTIGDENHIGPYLVDVQWSSTNLAVVDWSQVTKLGDELSAEQKIQHVGGTKEENTRLRLGTYKVAVRANRQLAVTMQAQGLNEDAARFAYRAQRLQRIVLRRQKKIGQYLFSAFLDLLAGYGFKPGRSVIAYLVIIFGFMGLYLLNAHFVAPHLRWDEALVLSVSSFHGRGFFSQDISLGDTYARLAAAEAVIGLIIEISFIATFTQRFFGK